MTQLVDDHEKEKITRQTIMLVMDRGSLTTLPTTLPVAPKSGVGSMDSRPPRSLSAEVPRTPGAPKWGDHFSQ